MGNIALERVLQLAHRLGRAIADTDRHKALEQVRQQVADDTAAHELLECFLTQQEKIDELMRKQAPVEVADKHRLSELQQRVSSHEGLKHMLKAQADYAELMHQVNGAIQAGLSGTSSPESD